MKRDIEKGLTFKPISTPPMVVVPLSSPIVKSSTIENIPFHGVEEPVTILGGDFTLSVQPPLVVSIDVPSGEELDELLERFPTFIDMERTSVL